MSSPTTVVRTVDYVGTFEELLAASEPEEANLTRLEVVELPKTRALEDRYAIVVSGTASRVLAQFLFGQAEAVFSAAKTKPLGPISRMIVDDPNYGSQPST